MAIIHVWSQFTPRDADGQRRHALAQSTWAIQPWINLPLADERMPRLFDEWGKKFPYIKDLLDTSCENRSPDDIVVFTNADIGVISTCCLRISLALQGNDAGYSFRRDLHKKVVAVPEDKDIKHWHNYPGTDMFFFRVRWWLENGKHMADMIPAREAWDACMRVLMEDTCPNKPLAVPDICWHERHGKPEGYWEDPTNRYTLPGQIHNLTAAKKFMIKRGRNPREFGIL